MPSSPASPAAFNAPSSSPDRRPPGGAGAGVSPWLRGLLIANLVAQIVIIVTGGLVRLTGSGLGCSTWPQCIPGSFTPVPQQEQGYHSLVEFGNRLLTFVLTAIAVALYVTARRQLRNTRPRFARLTLVPLLGIVAQAIVGGITVLASLDPKTVSPHFLLSIALVAYSAWLVCRFDDGGDGPREKLVPPRLYALGHAAAAVGGVVMILGTAVTGSGPHSGDADEPVRFGFDPESTARLHSGAVMVFVLLIIAVVALSGRVGAPTRYASRWLLLLALCVVEGAVGYFQYFQGLPIPVVTLHLLLSALIAAALVFAVMAGVRRTAAAA